MLKRCIIPVSFLIVILNLTIVFAAGNANPLAEGKTLPTFTVTEGKETKTFPSDFKGEVFALYFGNISTDQHGFQFLSWGGAFTVVLRQGDKSLREIYFAGIASLKDRPLYWVPLLVRKTFSDAMRKNQIKGKMFYDWDSAVAGKFNLEIGDIRAVIIDKKGVIRKVFDRKIYDLSKEERDETVKLFKELMNEQVEDEK